MTLLEEPTAPATARATAPAPDLATRAQPTAQITWIDVCALDDLDVDRGAGALIAGAPVAIFRCSPWDELFAIGNIDPYSNASVLSRGIVGSVSHRPVVASPVFKNRFDLHTGRSIDDPSVSVPVHPVRCIDGRVLVAAPLG